MKVVFAFLASKAQIAESHLWAAEIGLDRVTGSQLPFVLGELMCAFKFRFSPEEFDTEYTLKTEIIGPGEEDITSPAFNVMRFKPDPKNLIPTGESSLMGIFRMKPVVFKKEGPYNFRLTLNGTTVTELTLYAVVISTEKKPDGS